jgi:fructokinase
LTPRGHRIGIDLGGTKIEGLVIDCEGRELARQRVASPQHDYGATIRAIGALVAALEDAVGIQEIPLGLGIPGSISARTGRVRNANSTWLNGQRLFEDLEGLFGDGGHPRKIAIANDANCFALSEATDGAAQGARSVFGVIIGTGVGGGIVLNGAIVDGPLGIGGEWGHNSLPWPTSDEFHNAPNCWCGRRGCMEAWVSGPALARDHERATGTLQLAEDIVREAAGGDARAQASLDRHAGRLGRGLAHVINILDPEIVVLGGGLSQMQHLYDVLPSLIRPHIFSDAAEVAVRRPKWGDASGVRGAAWLATEF